MRTFDMGRIKTNLIKRTTKKLLKNYPDKFKIEFEHNKKALAELADIPSKKLRNSIAGYMVRLIKKQQE